MSPTLRFLPIHSPHAVAFFSQLVWGPSGTVWMALHGRERATLLGKWRAPCSYISFERWRLLVGGGQLQHGPDTQPPPHRAVRALRPDDPATIAHRSELISLAADVAWLLFLGRMPARSIRRLLAAAASAAARPAKPQNRAAGSAGPQAQAVALCERLRDAVRSSLFHWSMQGLQQLLWQLTLRFKLLQYLKGKQQQSVGWDSDEAGGGGAAGGGLNGDLGALPEFLPEQMPELPDLGGVVGALTQLPNHDGKRQQQQQAAQGEPAAAPLVPPRLTAVWRDIMQGRCLSGKRALVGIGERGEELQIWSRVAGEYLSSPALEYMTAVVDGITVSRTGEFTCPVACGALFLAQRAKTAGLGGRRHDGPGRWKPPAASAAATATAASQGIGGADAGSKVDSASRQEHWQQGQQPKEVEETDEEQEHVRNVLADMVQQKYVQALSDLTTLVAVEAAADAGLLPPVVARGSCPGAGEWVEFQRPPMPSLPEWSAGDGRAAMDATAAAAPGSVGASNSANGHRSSTVAATVATEVGSAAAAAAGGSCGGVAGGILWPVVWFRFFPHQGLGDEGDQRMALPPVLPPPWPLDAADMDIDMAPLQPLQPQPLQQPQPAQPPQPQSDEPWQRQDNGQSSSAPEPDLDMEVDVAPDRSLAMAPSAGVGIGDIDGKTNGSGDSDCRSDGHPSGSTRRQGEEGKEEEGCEKGAYGGDGEHEEEDDDDDSGSITLSTSSSIGSDNDDDDDDDGGPIPNFIADPSAEWEYELDFLYGIEGQPHSYYATAGHVDSDEEDVMAAPVHPFTRRAVAGDGDDNKDGPGPSSGGAAAAGSRDPRPAIGAAGDPLELSAGKSELRHSQSLGQGSLKSNSNSLKSQQPPGGGSGVGIGNGGGAGAGASESTDLKDAGAGPSSVADGGAAAGGGGGGGIALYETSGELFEGVSLQTWMDHLTRPDVARAVLASVAEVAGVQAIRHTFQNVQTALQPIMATRATATAVTRTVRRVEADGGVKDSGPTLRQTSCAAIDPAVAAATFAAAVAQEVAETAALVAVANSTNAPAGSAGASGGAVGPPMVFLPPDESADRAFQGLPEVPTLLPPPVAQQETQHQRSRYSLGTNAPQHQEQHQQQELPPPPMRPPPSGHLCMPLRQRWCGNTVLLKLIAPEDRSEAFGEDPDTDPNIDVQFVALRGVTLALRPPLRLTHRCG
ncbi:hypothetical protein Vretifemale_19265 [Volvox reticuliferus]|nr:hypothetical protein Vretifemale_19265 [Volvox reticuliferus]